jgi:hypothetical protein
MNMVGISKTTRVETTTTLDIDEEFIIAAIKQELRAQGFLVNTGMSVDFDIRQGGGFLSGATVKIVEVSEETE